MKKILLLVVLFILSLQANDQKITLGIGPYIQSQPYKNTSDIVLPSPVIFFDNGLLYVRWSRVGLYFYGKKSDTLSWGFSLTAQPRPFGYKPSDSSVLNGMDERKTSFEGGLAFSASYHNKEYIEVMFLHDLLHRNDGYIVRSEIGDKFELGKWTFYPSIIMIYQSQKFLNYYYGVKTTEATPLRGAYQTTDGFEYGVQTYIKYPFTKKLSMLTNVRYDRLSSTVTKSPIVQDNYIYSALFSLIYTFNY